jgi:hypothetical protein
VPQVLTTNAQIRCPHLGAGHSVPSRPWWRVDGGFVLREGDQGTLECIYCVGYELVSMGLNATRIDGRRVILTTDFNKSHIGLPLFMTETHTTKDDSTPAPIPNGAEPPPLSPELLDLVRPTVLVNPPTLAFNTTTMLSIPTPAATTFTLASDHPMQWMLRLVDLTSKTSIDPTSVPPPDVIVIPPDGAWDTPVLTVTVTMTPAFLASRSAGMHELWMTGVSRRGLAGREKLTITIS